MFDDLKAALTRNPTMLARDFAGATCLMVLLFVGLSIPGLG